ncbi:Nucleoporin [Zancudomyces culisetae]|uniref:Nuclear pore complex protein n=1 Tax=Zancudomyces culisetae TaxID=1213189 RepID=A0A1R1PRK7_ZANCU|nr:Nucleoporin [Zancudomyces culisetae]|eukprot:OMH83620.1 Nucleoporin [Zancudomyces culisetae]
MCEDGGNINRGLWLESCVGQARDGNADKYERAIYGVLVGSMSEALEVSTSWEDRIWVETSAMIEGEINEGLGMRLAGLGAPRSYKEIFDRNNGQMVYYSKEFSFNEIQKHLIENSLNSYIANISSKIKDG